MATALSKKDEDLHRRLNHTPGLDASEVKSRLSCPAEVTGALTPASKRVRISGSSDTSLSDDQLAPKSNNLVTPAPKSASSNILSEEDIKTLLYNEAGYSSTCSSAVRKRSDYLSWDDYFMAVAGLSVLRSKDPIRPTGACIVDTNNRIIGIGYNGFPSGCSDDCLPWTNRTSDPWLHTQTPYMVHAEVNAVLNKCAPSCNGARLYTKHFPCNECAKVIVQSGIAEIVYVENPDDKPRTTEEEDHLRASRILCTMAGVKLRPYRSERAMVQLDFSQPQHKRNDAEQESTQNATLTQRSLLESNYAVMYQALLQKEAGYDPVSVGPTKRDHVLSWDDYFMAMAFLTAKRSKDPNTQVGACIVDANKRIVGLGYNGFPLGCSDDHLPWARKASSALLTKYLYVCHAEVNAILNKGSADVRGATLYVALFPCNDCAKMIIQAGIREVVFMADHYHETDGCRASRILLNMAGVILRKHIPAQHCLKLHLEGDEDPTK